MQYYSLFHSWYCWLYFFSFYLSLSCWRLVSFIDLYFKESAFYIMDFLCDFPVFSIIRFLCLSLLFPFACFGIPWLLRRLSVCLQCRNPVRSLGWENLFLPGKSHGQRNLVDYSPWGLKQSDTTEWLHFHFACFGLVLLFIF